jgi:hypothetical protein
VTAASDPPEPRGWADKRVASSARGTISVDLVVASGHSAVAASLVTSLLGCETLVPSRRSSIRPETAQDDGTGRDGRSSSAVAGSTGVWTCRRGHFPDGKMALREMDTTAPAASVAVFPAGMNPAVRSPPFHGIPAHGQIVFDALVPARYFRFFSKVANTAADRSQAAGGVWEPLRRSELATLVFFSSSTCEAPRCDVYSSCVCFMIASDVSLGTTQPGWTRTPLPCSSSGQSESRTVPSNGTSGGMACLNEYR